MMADRKPWAVRWIDAVWLLFVLGLAFLPPLHEIHKQLILLAIGVFQLFEGSLIARLPQRGRSYSVLIKVLLATLLLDHTGELGINSSYWPIYFLPVITAAIYFGPVGTLLWTAASSLAYCSFLIPALQEYELTPEAITLLSIRFLFLFLSAILVNRFVAENHRQVRRYQTLSQRLEETNRQLQRAEAEARRSERLAALGQMSAGLAHEIRNPLGVIKGSAEMLAEKLGNTQPLAGELAGFISSEVNRLNGLVARFLDFARPLHPELRPQQMEEIVNHSLESVRGQFSDAPVRIERAYAPSLPGILADAQLCESVFINLFQNAYQAMRELPPGREGVLRVAMTPERSEGRAGIGVIVQDSGPGVAPELREQIFNPFFTSKQDGVGLGLAIVAKILDDHHGWIRLEDGASPGARFHIFLPAEPA